MNSESTLTASVHDDLWDEGQEEELEQAQGERERGPIVSVFHDFQSIPIEFDVSIESQKLECLDWDLVSSAVFGLVGGILEGKIELDWATWQLDFVVLAGTERRGQIPESHQDRGGCEDGKEDGCLESSANLPCQICWDDEDKAKKGEVREGIRTRAVRR